MKAQRLAPAQAKGADGIVTYGPTRLRRDPARVRTGVPTTSPLATGVSRAHRDRGDQPPERRDCRACGTNFQPKVPRQVVCDRTCAVANAREHLGGPA